MCVCVCAVVQSCSDSLQPYGLYIARQAPLSMGFASQEYWSGLPFPPPGALPNPGIKPASPVSPAPAGGFSTAEPLRSPGPALHQGEPAWCSAEAGLDS